MTDQGGTWAERQLSGDQTAVLAIIRGASHPMSPAEVAVSLGEARTPRGAGRTLSALFQRGLVDRSWGGRTPLYFSPGEAA